MFSSCFFQVPNINIQISFLNLKNIYGEERGFTRGFTSTLQLKRTPQALQKSLRDFRIGFNLGSPSLGIESGTATFSRSTIYTNPKKVSTTLKKQFGFFHFACNQNQDALLSGVKQRGQPFELKVQLERSSNRNQPEVGSPLVGSSRSNNILGLTEVRSTKDSVRNNLPEQSSGYPTNNQSSSGYRTNQRWMQRFRVCVNISLHTRKDFFTTSPLMLNVVPPLSLPSGFVTLVSSPLREVAESATPLDLTKSLDLATFGSGSDTRRQLKANIFKDKNRDEEGRFCYALNKSSLKKRKEHP